MEVEWHNFLFSFSLTFFILLIITLHQNSWKLRDLPIKASFPQILRNTLCKSINLITYLTEDETHLMKSNLIDGNKDFHEDCTQKASGNISILRHKITDKK